MAGGQLVQKRYKGGSERRDTGQNNGDGGEPSTRSASAPDVLGGHAEMR